METKSGFGVLVFQRIGDSEAWCPSGGESFGMLSKSLEEALGRGLTEVR